MRENTITPELVKQAGQLLKKEHAERVRLEKVASENEREKRAQKLAFREVELGLAEPFKTYEEMQEKVASLLEDDLDVLEKALERGYTGSRNFGELVGGEKQGKQHDPITTLIMSGDWESN